MPRPFRIEVPDAVLADLRRRLAGTRWPEPIPGAEWDYGAKVDDVRDLCEYWRDGYDWRAHEAELNAIPGFRHEVDGVDLHFWHVRGPRPTRSRCCCSTAGRARSSSSTGPRAAERAGGSTSSCPPCPGFGFGGRPRERGWGVRASPRPSTR